MQPSELYYNFIDNEKCENELTFRIYIFEEIIATTFLKFVKTNFGAVYFFFFLEKKKKKILVPPRTENLKSNSEKGNLSFVFIIFLAGEKLKINVW